MVPVDMWPVKLSARTARLNSTVTMVSSMRERWS